MAFRDSKLKQGKFGHLKMFPWASGYTSTLKKDREDQSFTHVYWAPFMQR